MSWEGDLSPEERKQWEDFVHRARSELVPMIDESAFVTSLVSDKEPDVKFAVETGFAILLDKPIVLVVPKGVSIPGKLELVADAIIRPTHDIDTEAGQKEIQDELQVFLGNFGK